jgi:hypothetical protein
MMLKKINDARKKGTRMPKTTCGASKNRRERRQGYGLENASQLPAVTPQAHWPLKGCSRDHLTT